MFDKVELITNNIIGPNTERWIDVDPGTNDRAIDFCFCRSGICFRNENCTNYNRNIECGEICFNSKCLNRHSRFTFGTSVYRSLHLEGTRLSGWGLFTTTELIIAGSVVLPYNGEVISELEFLRRRSLGWDNRYMMRIGNFYIEALHKCSLARYINNSCSPNMEAQVWTCEGKLICNLVAVENINGSIQVPVQLTFKYGWTLDEFDDDSLIDLHPCYCGHSCCTGSIYSAASRDNSFASDISLGSQDTL